MRKSKARRKDAGTGGRADPGRSGIAGVHAYDGPSGGWGSARGVTAILTQERVPLSGPAALLRQNKPDGFMCVSCAWAKPAKPHPLEFCENGAKATAWEITSRARRRRPSSPRTR